MFLLVSGRHVVCHPDVHQHGVSIQISINFGKIFLWISRIRNFALTCSLRNMAFFSGALLRGEAARKTKTFLLLPPRSPRSFSAPLLGLFARRTKTAMLHRQNRPACEELYIFTSFHFPDPLILIYSEWRDSEN